MTETITRCPQCAGMRGFPKIIEIDGKTQECLDHFHTETPPIEFHPAVTKMAPPPSLEPPPQPDAKCPHPGCIAQPVEVLFNEVTFPDGRKAYIFYCSKCLRLIPVALQPIVMAKMPVGMRPQ